MDMQVGQSGGVGQHTVGHHGQLSKAVLHKSIKFGEIHTKLVQTQSSAPCSEWTVRHEFLRNSYEISRNFARISYESTPFSHASYHGAQWSRGMHPRSSLEWTWTVDPDPSMEERLVMAVWRIRSLHVSRTAGYPVGSMTYGVVWEQVYGMLRKLAASESQAFTAHTEDDTAIHGACSLPDRLAHLYNG